ncbi:MAG: hypothetical protein IJY04_05840, partial [Clostridia bacterium]|nr:hypothetical protein [Clostridia bacterium]
MKKIRILALVLAIFALTAMLFLVSCDGGGSSGGNQNSCEVNGHKWPEKWTSNGDATCTEDGTRSRKCPVCKEQQVEPDPDTATGHFFVDYVLDGDATCTEDGHETAKCYICEVATDTRLAVDSALGHRWGSQPVSSVNGFDTLRCLREGCGV